MQMLSFKHSCNIGISLFIGKVKANGAKTGLLENSQQLTAWFIPSQISINWPCFWLIGIKTDSVII